MRILYGIESFRPNVSGVVIFTERVASYMASRGHDVWIFTTAPTGLPMAEKDPSGFTIYRFGGLRNPFRKDLRFSPPWNSRKVRMRFEEVGPHLVHLQDQGPLNRMIIHEAMRRGIPVIAHHHFSMEFVLGYFGKHLMFFKPAVRIFIKAASRNFYNKASQVLTPTDFSRRTLLSWGIKTPVSVVSNGVELERFNPVDTKEERKDLKEAAEKFSIPAKTPVVLYIGRMDKDKNIWTLVRAIPKILSKATAIFLFVGDGTEREALEQYIKKQSWREKVIFTGFISHSDPLLPKMYQLADIVWTASTIETQSITTLEAMACGLPIVAANAGALPELVHEGKNGFLVEPYDVSGFGESVLELLADKALAKRFGKASLEIASAHALDKSLEKIADIYRETISGEEHPI
jgi:1,2-diacylglycerol 3-alpha-glucosyltransferase